MKNIFVLSMTVVALLSTGCKLSKEEREKKEIEKGERIAARSEDRQEDKEAEKVRVAYADLAERLRIYQAIAGTYHGQINEYDTRSLRDVRIRVSVVNLPAALDETRPETEAEVIKKKEDLAFDIVIEELNRAKKVESRRKKIAQCSVDNNKPNLVNGNFTVECPELLAGADAPKYVLGFEASKKGIKNMSVQDLEAQNIQTAQDLISNKLGRIEALNVTFSSPAMIGSRVGRVTREDSVIEPTPKWVLE